MRTTLIGLGLALLPKLALAQHCHSEAPQESKSPTSLTVRGEFASYRQVAFEGHYEGVFAGVQRDFDFMLVGARLPAYALMRNGEAIRGIGDVSVEANVPLRFASARPRNFGIALLTTLPTGDADKSLGMGHVMFMPQAWYRLTEGRFEFQTSLGAGLAWTNSDGGHHHHGPQPVVSPMNGEELTFHAQPSYSFAPKLKAQVRVSGALPLAENGTSRVLVGAGVEAQSGSFFSSLELSAPLVGDPYQGKLSLGLGTRF